MTLSWNCLSLLTYETILDTDGKTELLDLMMYNWHGIKYKPLLILF